MKSKKLLAYVLTGALCCSILAGLSGCGGKDGKSADPEHMETPAPTETAEPEYVYVPEYVDIDGRFKGGFDNMIYSNGRFLASMYTKLGEREKREGEEVIYEGQLDVYGNKLYWLSLDGRLEEVSGYAPMPAPESGDGSSYLQRMMISPTGDIVTLEMTYRNWYDGPTDVEMYSDEWNQKGYAQYQHNEQHAYLRTLNPDGTEKSCVCLDSLKKEDQDTFYLNNIQVDGAGNFYCVMDQTVFLLGSDGALRSTITGDNWFDRLIRMGDGSVAGSYWGENGQVMCVIDPASGTLGEPIKLPNNSYNMAQNLAGGYDLCYTDGNNFMGYTLADGKQEKILNWLNSDVDNDNTGAVFVLPDGRIMTTENVYHNDDNNYSIRIVLLNKVPASSVPQKTRLIFATQSLSYQARSAIIEFNRKNDQYRIELRDYSEYNTQDDYSAGLTKLTTEIMAGNIPDILDLQGLPVQKLASRGLLADLYPLLDSDTALSRDAIFPGVLKALEQNGHLYRTASGFQINTVVGAASVVGNGPGWTLAEFKKALASMPGGCQPFAESITRDLILEQMLRMNLGALVDWDTGKCSFDAPFFRDILEFSAQFPETYEREEGREWTEEDEEPNRVAAGKQMLMQVSLSDFNDIQMYNAMFGGAASFIGYPVSEGVGSALALNEGGYAISAKCAAPEAAWQFVRRSFTEEYQSRYGWGFPSNRAAFDKRLKEAMTPEYMKDDNGNFILDENGEKVKASRGGWSTGSIVHEFYELQQTEADQILNLINGTARVTDQSDDELMKIITQDTAPYFAGQKSLDDVVRQLQSKMNIYINEQR